MRKTAPEIGRATSVESSRMCRGLMVREGRGPVTPADTFRSDALDTLLPLPPLGWTWAAKVRGDVVGFIRAAPAFSPDHWWVTDAAGEGLDAVWSRLVSEARKAGVRQIHWHTPDPWLDAVMPGLVRGYEPSRSGPPPEVCSLGGRELDEFSVTEWAGGGPRFLRSVDPAGEINVQSPDSMADLEGVYALQKEVGWGDTASPARCFVPDLLGIEAGSPPGRTLVAKADKEIVGYVRITATAERGVGFGHEAVIHPDMQGRGLGTAMALAAAEQLAALGFSRVIALADPLNLPSLRMNLIGLGGVGIYLVDDLYGRWFTPLHGGSTTPRIVVEHRGAGPRGPSRGGHPRTPGSADAPVVRLGDAGPGTFSGLAPRLLLSVDGPIDLRDEKLKRRLVAALSSAFGAGYRLASVDRLGDGWGYLLTRSTDAGEGGHIA